MSAINLGIMIFVSFYYQMKDEEAASSQSETDALQIRNVFLFSGGKYWKELTAWSLTSRSMYSIWGGISIVASLPGIVRWENIPFYSLAAISTLLMTTRLSGGTRGKVWEKLNNALQVTGGILPRPAIN